MKTFHVIRAKGDAKRAETLHGVKVYRKEKIEWELGRFIKCAPYDNHFVYIDPTRRHGWVSMCSCGAPSVVVGYNAYRQDGSPTTSEESTTPGEMIVCFLHAMTGRHADGST